MADLIERDAAIKLIQPRVKPKTVYGEGYLNAIEHVTELLALMPSASIWIPCSERLPEKDMSVLISAQGHRVTAYYDSVKGVFMLTETEGLFYSMSAVTHWMPLPEPPQRKDDTHDYD